MILKELNIQSIFNCYSWSSLVAQLVKNPPAMQETWVQSLGWEDPLQKGMATHPVFWPGEFHGQRSLAGYSPWGHKKSKMTVQLLFSLLSVGFVVLKVQNNNVIYLNGNSS